MRKCPQWARTQSDIEQVAGPPLIDLRQAAVDPHQPFALL